MTTYSFDQLRDAVQECTSYDLADVEDFIRNNDQVDQYLYELTNQ